LSKLEERGCDITYPDHFNPFKSIEDAKEKLEKVIADYRQSKEANPELESISAGNPNSSDDSQDGFIKQLFHRYLTEGIAHRSSANTQIKRAAEIVASTEPFLKFVKQNPKHLPWIDEVCNSYLEGCVNQPVAGFSEINALIAIASEESLADKVFASNHLYALELIKPIVTGNPPPAGLEVEAGNALLIEVHKQLLENKIIEKPWLAVPEKIAHAANIKSWLERDKIGEETKKLVAEISRLNEKNQAGFDHYADFLCERHHNNTWGKIAFPEEIKEIAKTYEAKLENNTDSEASGEELDAISVERERAIVTKVRELTLAGFKEASPAAAPSLPDGATLKTEVRNTQTTKK